MKHDSSIELDQRLKITTAVCLDIAVKLILFGQFPNLGILMC